MKRLLAASARLWQETELSAVASAASWKHFLSSEAGRSVCLKISVTSSSQRPARPLSWCSVTSRAAKQTHLSVWGGDGPLLLFVFIYDLWCLFICLHDVWLFSYLFTQLFITWDSEYWFSSGYWSVIGSEGEQLCHVSMMSFYHYDEIIDRKWFSSYFIIKLEVTIIFLNNQFIIWSIKHLKTEKCDVFKYFALFHQQIFNLLSNDWLEL